MRRSALVLAALLVVVPACGGGGTDVSEAVAIQLKPEVQAERIPEPLDRALRELEEAVRP